MVGQFQMHVYNSLALNGNGSCHKAVARANAPTTTI